MSSHQSIEPKPDKDSQAISPHKEEEKQIIKTEDRVQSACTFKSIEALQHYNQPQIFGELSVSNEFGMKFITDLLRSTLMESYEKMKKKICERQFSEPSQASKNILFNEITQKALSSLHLSSLMSPLQNQSPKISQSVQQSYSIFRPFLTASERLFTKQKSITPLNSKFVQFQPSSERISSKKQSQSLSQINQEQVSWNYESQQPGECLKEEIVNYGRIYGINNASKFFKVRPYKLKKWFKQMNLDKGPRGRKPVDPSMEEKICEWLDQQLKKGIHLTQKQIREQAMLISKCSQFRASKGWVQKLFKRRPDLFQAYTQNRKNSKNKGKLTKEEQLQNEDSRQRILNQEQSTNRNTNKLGEISQK